MSAIEKWAARKGFNKRDDLESIAINAALYGELCEAWIPRGTLEERILTVLNPRRLRFSNDKTFQAFFDHSSEDILVSRINGLFYCPSRKRVIAEADATEAITSTIQTLGGVVAKKADSNQGRGVEWITSQQDLTRVLSTNADLIIQPPFEQLGNLSCVNDSSVNSV